MFESVGVFNSNTLNPNNSKTLACDRDGLRLHRGELDELASRTGLERNADDGVGAGRRGQRLHLAVRVDDQLVAGIPDGAATTTQKILNKGGATAPVTDQKEVEKLRNKAIGEYRAAHPGCTFTTAWGACRKENPELFQ